MDLKDIMAISGLPGLYKVMANRTDGVIVEGFHDKAKKFVSSRQHMFTPLENITIYTTEDSIELKLVFSSMKKDEASNAIPDLKKVDDAGLRKYMKSVLPNYDEEKVYTSDIKKLIKWYQLLDAHNIIAVIDEKAEETANKTEEQEATPTETPKKKAAKKPAKTAEEPAVETAEAPKKKKTTKKAE